MNIFCKFKFENFTPGLLIVQNQLGAFATAITPTAILQQPALQGLLAEQNLLGLLPLQLLMLSRAAQHLLEHLPLKELQLNLLTFRRKINFFKIKNL